MSWTTTTRTSAEELRPPDEKNSSTSFEPNDHLITEAWVEFAQESVSNGSLKTSTTMTSPSVRRSSMRAEDEPINLKEKACHPVCRPQSVLVERRSPLFVVTQVTLEVTKFRDKTLKANRFELS